MNARAQTSRGQTEEPASRTDVQKALALEVVNFEHLLERFFRPCNALFVKHIEKPTPVLAELESFAVGNLDCVCAHN